MRACARRGLTLVELVVAAGLLSILLVALLALMDDFLSLWEKSEVRRATVEESAGVVELLATDLAGLEPGARGDLLAEWAFFDTDGDGVEESAWPRLRLVRHATAREIELQQAARTQKIPGQGLFEIVWAVLPARAQSNDADLRAEGVLWRGERLLGDPEGLSFFDDAYLSSRGYPAPGTTQDVSRGVLWLSLTFATQTSNLHGEWRLGDDPGDVRPSWDGWLKGRANAERHTWNEFGAGLVRPADRPLLPRRVRIELELERERDLKRRTRLARLLEPGDSALALDDITRVPRERGRHVRVDAEWMEVLSASGSTLSVRRGARGTRPTLHKSGALVHYGETVVREVPLSIQQEDWGL
jgi:hypothetical protein